MSNSQMQKTRIAIVVSHPIQHFCPQYESWATIPSLEIRVFFASKHGIKEYADPNFGLTIRWESITLNFPHEFLPGADDRALSNSIDSEELAGRLEAFSPNVTLIYGYAQRVQRRALSWAHLRGVPIFMMGDSERRSRRSPLVRLGKTLVLPRLFRRISRFLTVGDANEDYYRHYGVPDDRLIRTCFPIDRKHYDANLHHRQEMRTEVRTKLNIPPHHRVCLMVGKLVSWKRQTDLLTLSNDLGEVRQDHTVLLVGSGKDEELLRKQAARHGPGGVIFAGFVSPSDLPKFYFAADAYVHCSEVEPHSLAISEAIYCGLPVIASDRCGSYGPCDDVRVGMNGFIYACGNTAQLASLALRLFEDRERYRAMSAHSSRIAQHSQALSHGDGVIQAIESLQMKQVDASPRASHVI
jgi:glycosyltransferase involved in cell wall biosynthesis